MSRHTLIQRRGMHSAMAKVALVEDPVICARDDDNVLETHCKKGYPTTEVSKCLLNLIYPGDCVGK